LQSHPLRPDPRIAEERYLAVCVRNQKGIQGEIDLPDETAMEGAAEKLFFPEFSQACCMSLLAVGLTFQGFWPAFASLACEARAWVKIRWL
jgi:hypothetical protein